MAYTLTEKLPQYLVRLHGTFDQKGQTHLRDLIAACHYHVREAEKFDNWNNGQWGHGVVLFVPLAELSKIDIEIQDEVCEDFRELLNKLARAIDDEWFHAVNFELFDENDAECKEARPFSQSPPINPDALDFWKPGQARVFVSHRDQYKKEARDLSDALEEYGISCFVAHDTIRPMAEWRTEIMKGLQTMEVMLLFLTDNFEESMWCHQEVGFALGKGVPIVSLKLETKDPPGFISHVQAMRGKMDDPFASSRGLFPLIGKALRRQERLQEILIKSFIESPSWIDAKARFNRMKEGIEKLSEKQLEEIIRAYKTNDQLYGSIYLDNPARRLAKFLEDATGKKFEIKGHIIKELVEEFDDDPIPF